MQLKYIAESEIDGDIQPKLLRRLDCFIAAIRSIFSIHHMASGTHADDSYHYKGMAADGHRIKDDFDRKPSDEDIQIMADNMTKLINKPNKTIFEQACIARLSGFSGIGIYPHWYPKPGLHLDIRPVEKTEFWIGLNKDILKKEINKTEENQIYIYL